MSTVAVLGPGAVGGALAARLATAGVQTVCVARPETVGALALAGIEVQTPAGRLHARCEAVERLTQPVDLLVIAVKAPVLREALERIEPSSVEDAVVVPLLNGLEHMDVLRARFDGRVAAGTVSHYQAYRAGRVQVVEASPPPVVTVASETVAPEKLDEAVRALRAAGLEVHVGTSEKRVLWHKLARIAPLAAATSATGRTLGELRHDVALRARLHEAVAETCRVAEADGVSIRPAEQLTILERMADETTTSAARDVAAGRRSELDAIVGSVLRAAERHGVPCPALMGLAVDAGLV